MDTDSEYYNIYSKEPTAKVTIYTSVLYFVIVIYESMADVFLTKISLCETKLNRILQNTLLFELRARSNCIHEQVAKRIANVHFTQLSKSSITENGRKKLNKIKGKK